MLLDVTDDGRFGDGLTGLICEQRLGTAWAESRARARGVHGGVNRWTGSFKVESSGGLGSWQSEMATSIVELA